MKPKLWDKEEIELLSLWLNEGLTHSIIANELNRTTSSISRKVQKLGLGKGAHVKTHKEYIEELKEKCPTIKCLEIYKGTHVPILHKCLKCNETSMAEPSNKIQGKACKYCDNGIPKRNQDILYLVYFYTINLYKIGITSRNVVKRLHGIGYPYEIILIRKDENAKILEHKWLTNINNYKVNTGLLKSGNTETFRY